MHFQKEVLIILHNMINNFSLSQIKYQFKDFIGIYDNAFTLEECQKTIELFETFHENGYTYSRNIEGASIPYFKQDTSLSVTPSLELEWNNTFIKSFHERFYNIIYPIYNNQYPILQKLCKHRSKNIKIQKTYPAEGYHVWHCEHDSSPHARDRILSWILYLNDVEEGGETEFLYQSLRFKPKVGTMILFPAHFTHTHRGNPPLSGIKYIATGWIEFLNTTEIQGGFEFPDLNPDIKSRNKEIIQYN